jgi:hypothetical protein
MPCQDNSGAASVSSASLTKSKEPIFHKIEVRKSKTEVIYMYLFLPKSLFLLFASLQLHQIVAMSDGVFLLLVYCCCSVHMWSCVALLSFVLTKNCLVRLLNRLASYWNQKAQRLVELCTEFAMRHFFFKLECFLIPPDTAFKQQRLSAVRPIFTPLAVSVLEIAPLFNFVDWWPYTLLIRSVWHSWLWGSLSSSLVEWFQLRLNRSVVGVVFVCQQWIHVTPLPQQIKEMSLQYDGDGADVSGCAIDQASAATTCTVSFTAESDMDAPVYVYYQLSNFYQVRTFLLLSNHCPFQITTF